MARKVRVFVKDTSIFIYLRSLKNLYAFCDDEDFNLFLDYIKELKDVYALDVHAYSLKKDSIYFLITPKQEDSVARFMQALGRRYVRYYNDKYHRSGTIWEGRYKSSLVQNKYILDVMIYIERLADLKYSSKLSNLQAKSDDIVTFHSVYKSFGYTPKERSEKYSKLFSKGISNERVTFIEECLQKQLVIGSKEYIKNLEKILGITLLTNSRGRPKKNQNKGRKMYKNLVVLDKEQHKDLRLNPMKDLAFAKGAAFIPVLASEVEQVAKAFPVVFTADENPSLVALVSLGGDSLAINEEGKWITNYVPLFLRRYPFSLAAAKENSDQKIVLIDEDSELFSKEEGSALFDENGEQTETLNHAIDFLNNFESQAVITKNVAKLISDSGILEDREITVGEGEESKTLVDGFKVVNREKLNELSDDVLADWVRKGIINMIEAHLKSLAHIETLFKLAMQKQNIK